MSELFRQTTCTQVAKLLGLTMLGLKSFDELESQAQLSSLSRLKVSLRVILTAVCNRGFAWTPV